MFAKDLKLIVGLGNPGLRYRHTRHNLGFMVLDAILKSVNNNCPKKLRFRKSRELKSELLILGSVILAKPHTYMNCSGESVARIKEKFHLLYKNILVICDDLNLPIGKIRVRPRGSSGGHNGLKSIIKALGSSCFPRLRIGIRAAGLDNGLSIPDDRASFVLSDFTTEEKINIQYSIAKSVTCCLAWFQGEDLSRLMSGYN